MVSNSGIKGQYPAGIDPALIHLVGTIVTWWGRIEGCLVFDLISLRQHANAREYAEKHRFPVSTGPLIEQWSALRRLVFRDNPKKLAEALALQGDLTDASQDRNVVVHYFWPYGTNNADGALTLQSIKTRRKTHSDLEFRSVTVDAHKLDNINETLVRLYHRVMVSGVQLIVGPDRIVAPTIDKDRPATKGGGGRRPQTHKET